jgi:nitroimidazol reductase NimA-like FMN-containing flavoprotein (pyridoxamine 5'-phosphate oxidase superfamily)
MFIKELETSECFEILAEKRLGRLACAFENQPYIVPFHFVYDEQKSLYAFSTLGQKIEWMRANPLVCVEADDINNHLNGQVSLFSGVMKNWPKLPNLKPPENGRMNYFRATQCGGSLLLLPELTAAK